MIGRGVASTMFGRRALAVRLNVDARLSACGKEVAHLPLLTHGASTPWIAFEPQSAPTGPNAGRSIKRTGPTGWLATRKVLCSVGGPNRRRGCPAAAPPPWPHIASEDNWAFVRMVLATGY